MCKYTLLYFCDCHRVIFVSFWRKMNSWMHHSLLRKETIFCSQSKTVTFFKHLFIVRSRQSSTSDHLCKLVLNCFYYKWICGGLLQKASTVLAVFVVSITFPAAAAVANAHVELVDCINFSPIYFSCCPLVALNCIGRNGRIFSTHINEPLRWANQAWMCQESGIIIEKTGDFGSA